IRVIAGTEHFPGANAHLENGGASGNGRRDGHESHDLLLAAPGQACQKAADSLNTVLRVAGNANHRLRDLCDRGRATGGGGGQSCFTHESKTSSSPGFTRSAVEQALILSR